MARRVLLCFWAAIVTSQQVVVVRAGGKLTLLLGSPFRYRGKRGKATGVFMKMRKPRAKQPGVFVGTRFQPELLKRLDDWRRDQPDIPNRSEAIRRLVEKGSCDR
jgi:hypothetical protein